MEKRCVREVMKSFSKTLFWCKAGIIRCAFANNQAAGEIGLLCDKNYGCEMKMKKYLALAEGPFYRLLTPTPYILFVTGY